MTPPHTEPSSTRTLVGFQRLLFPEPEDRPSLGFVTRLIVATTFPHSQPTDNEFTRNSGLYDLCLLSPRRVGLPYGRYPRLALAWMITEAVRTRSPRLLPGPSFSTFALRIGITPSSGPKGTLVQLREQLHRLLNVTVVCLGMDHDPTYAFPPAFRGGGVHLFKSYHLWWDDSAERDHPPSFFQLSEDFFQEILTHPIPVDLEVVRSFRSPLEMDVYMWLTYRSIRACRIRRPETIPWEALQQQFGAAYGELRMFRFNFLRALKKVIKVYATARLRSTPAGLVLLPYPPHVARLPRASL